MSLLEVDLAGAATRLAAHRQRVPMTPDSHIAAAAIIRLPGIEIGILARRVRCQVCRRGENFLARAFINELIGPSALMQTFWDQCTPTYGIERPPLFVLTEFGQRWILEQPVLVSCGESYTERGVQVITRVDMSLSAIYTEEL